MNWTLVALIAVGFAWLVVVVIITDSIIRWIDRGRWLESPTIHKCHPPKLWWHKIGGLWQCNTCNKTWQIQLVNTGVSQRKGWVRFGKREGD